MYTLLLVLLGLRLHQPVLPTDSRPEESPAALSAADAVLSGADGQRFWLVKVDGRFRQFRRKADIPDADDVFVVGSRKGAVVAVALVSTSESGDWVNTYTHFFGPDGRATAFRGESRFFNGACPGAPEEPLTETTWVYLTGLAPSAVALMNSGTQPIVVFQKKAAPFTIVSHTRSSLPWRA